MEEQPVPLWHVVAVVGCSLAGTHGTIRARGSHPGCITESPAGTKHLQHIRAKRCQAAAADVSGRPEGEMEKVI